MSLEQIITVNITRQTTAASRAGFGTMLILGAHAVFSERTRTYTSAADMLTDGFESTDPEYLAAAAAFSQNPKPTQVKIGRRQVDVVGISVDTVIDSTDYTVTIDGTPFVFASGVGATAISIAAGLVALIDADASYTATDDLDGTFTVSHATAGTGFAVAVDANMSIEKPLATVDTVAVDLAAVKNIDDDWYALVLTSHVQADVEAAAAWIETERKIFGTSSSDADILDSASTADIAYVLNAAAYDRTFVLYSASEANYPEAAWLGKQLPTDPGSTTWAYKTLSGVTYDALTTTQSTNARNKKCNTYESIGGVSITREGQMVSGEYIDIMRGVDWLQTRMTERIYTRLVNLPKVPFTDPGVAIIETDIRAQLDDGVSAGFLATSPAYTVSVPLVANVSTTDKANRLLPDITFEATLAGAIHKTTINGVVSL